MIETESFPLLLALYLSAIALIIVLLAASGNKYAKVTGALASGAFGLGILLLVSQGLGYFGSMKFPNTSTLLASDWVSILFGLAVLSASFLVGLTAHNGWGTLIRIRNPHVERNSCEFYPKSREYECQSKQRYGLIT